MSSWQLHGDRMRGRGFLVARTFIHKVSLFKTEPLGECLQKTRTHLAKLQDQELEEAVEGWDGIR